METFTHFSVMGNKMWVGAKTFIEQNTLKKTHKCMTLQTAEMPIFSIMSIGSARLIIDVQALVNEIGKPTQ